MFVNRRDGKGGRLDAGAALAHDGAGKGPPAPAGGAMAFFEMGGYAAYVWPAFGTAAVFLIALLVASLRAMRAREAELRALEAARGARRGADERKGGREKA